MDFESNSCLICHQQTYLRCGKAWICCKDCFDEFRLRSQATQDILDTIPVDGYTELKASLQASLDRCSVFFLRKNERVIVELPSEHLIEEKEETKPRKYIPIKVLHITRPTIRKKNSNVA